MYRDIKKQPLTAPELAELAHRGGITVRELLNPKSKAFREMQLDYGTLTDKAAAEIITTEPTAMVRPLLSDGERTVVGFDPVKFAGII